MSLTLAQLNQLPTSEFIQQLGGIFEHSPWVAEQVATLRPFNSVDDLHQAMVRAIEQAGKQAQLDLIRAHPELGGKLAVRGELTEESTKEQAGAGLNQCSPEEFATLTSLNERYGKKFGFPFILAVRGHNRQSIISEFSRRVALSLAEEQKESLQQIYQIGLFRLQDLIEA